MWGLQNYKNLGRLQRAVKNKNDFHIESRFYFQAEYESGFFCLLHAAFFDTGFLACEATEIVKFRATNLTELVDGDRFNEG